MGQAPVCLIALLLDKPLPFPSDMQLTIGKKLYLFAAIALLMLIALTTINLFGGRQANADMQNMVEHEI